jgi:hypothetical protein
MSRTYRKYPVPMIHWKRDLIRLRTLSDYYKFWDENEITNFRMDYERFDNYNFLSRDSKPCFKPDKKFKKIMRKKRKAKNKHEFRNGKEITNHRKEDVWDWN